MTDKVPRMGHFSEDKNMSKYQKPNKRSKCQNLAFGDKEVLHHAKMMGSQTCL